MKIIVEVEEDEKFYEANKESIMSGAEMLGFTIKDIRCEI